MNSVTGPWKFEFSESSAFTASFPDSSPQPRQKSHVRPALQGSASQLLTALLFN